MNKLFGLFLLALAFLAPNAAYAVTCFWVGGTASWDGTNTGGGGAGGIKWASASGGGTTCAGGGTGGSPSTGDSATFDASSGTGTVTVNTTVAIISLDMSAFTGPSTLDFATNNNNVTLSSSTTAFISTGAGNRTLNMGNGTWTLSGATAIWTAAGSTNFTLNANGSTVAFTGTASGQREFRAGTSKTYNNITVNSSVDRFFQLSGATAIGINTLTITGPNRVQFQQGITTTITTLSNISANSTNQCLLTNNNPSNGQATISSGNNFTADYCAISGLAFTGAGTFAATNSMNVGQATGITISLPSGGGAGGRIIGG